MCRMCSGRFVIIDSASEVRRICPPPSPLEPSISTTATTASYASRSALDADDLAKLMYDLDEVRLRRHDLVDVLVSHRRLVDHARVLLALDALGRLDVILDGEPPLRLATRHHTAGAMAARHVRIRVALAADD